MNLLKKLLISATAAGLIGIAPAALAVPFTITSASMTPGTGYGIDAAENSATLLDVRFSTALFTTQSFSLNSAGNFFTFNVGTLNFQEPNAMSGIVAAETDNLGVSASFTFTNPLGVTQSVTATGTATVGAVSDSFVDYTLVWNPVSVAFGAGGIFDITLADMTFSTMGTQTETATVTLRTAPTGVPEPATLALIGIALLGAGGLRRKTQSRNA